MNLSSRRTPLSSYTILMAISFLVGLSSFFIPSGTFTYKKEGSQISLPSDKALPLTTIISENLVPVQGSYHTLPNKTLSWSDFIKAPLIGAKDIIDFILFTLILGVFLEILKSLHIFEKLCSALISIHCPPFLLLVLFFFLLSLLSSVTGLRDENIIFFSLLVPLFSSYGIPRLTTSLMILLAVVVGIVSSTLNPTIVGIFSSFSREPLVNGIGIRFLLLLLGLLVGFIIIWRTTPKKYTYPPDNSPIPSFFWKIFLSMGVIFFAFILLIYDLISGSPLSQTTATLLFLSLFAGIIGGLPEHEIISALKVGMQSLLPIAINMSIARGILYLMEKSEIRDTLLFGCFSLLGGQLPIWAFSMEFILLVSCGFFLINSTSAMASLIFPLLYPVFISLKIPYSIFILWFLIAAGLSQMFNPTGFLLNHIRKETSLSYKEWIRFAFPLGVLYLIIWGGSLFF